MAMAIESCWDAVLGNRGWAALFSRATGHAAPYTSVGVFKILTHDV